MSGVISFNALPTRGNDNPLPRCQTPYRSACIRRCRRDRSRSAKDGTRLETMGVCWTYASVFIRVPKLQRPFDGSTAVKSCTDANIIGYYLFGFRVLPVPLDYTKLLLGLRPQRHMPSGPDKSSAQPAETSFPRRFSLGFDRHFLP